MKNIILIGAVATLATIGFTGCGATNHLGKVTDKTYDYGTYDYGYDTQSKYDGKTYNKSGTTYWEGYGINEGYVMGNWNDAYYNDTRKASTMLLD